MLKINLVNELTNLKKKQKTDNSEWLVEEAKSFLQEKTNDDLCLLEYVGFRKAISERKERVSESDNLTKINNTFGEENIFTTNQIKKICVKYDLRFLSPHDYKGHLDPVLPQKIRAFEDRARGLGVCVHESEISREVRHLYSHIGFTYGICAPASSFELKERPKDPLMFGYINNGKWVLVHKWGNDLSLLRRIKIVLRRTFLLIGPFLSALLFLLSGFILNPERPINPDNGVGFIISLFVFILCVPIYFLFVRGDFGENWNSRHL